MAVAAGWSLLTPTSGRAGRAGRHSGTAGSLVLRRMDRRGHKKGLLSVNEDSSAGVPAGRLCINGPGWRAIAPNGGTPA